MNAKNTTGPWKAIRNPGREPATYYVVNADGKFCIADLPSGSTCTEANARLIAAAPDLLTALKEARSLLETASRYFPKSIKNGDRFSLLNVLANSVNPAIKKAQGEA